MTLNLSDTLRIDVRLLTGDNTPRFASIGKSGSGKTNDLIVAAEEWIAAGFPLTFVVPVGKTAQMLANTLPVVIAGRRKSAHVEITADNAAELARYSLRERVPVVLDMVMYTKDDEMDVLYAYLNALWSELLFQDDDHHQPYALFVDEAHLYVPQGGSTPISPVLTDINKRGRHMSLFTFVSSQRAASLDKDFLTQANLLFAHRVMLGVDSKVLQEQLPLPPRELNAMMRKLNKGEAIVIGDSEFIGDDNDYLQVQIRPNASIQLANDGYSPLPIGALRPIDESFLTALRAALTTDATPAPTQLSSNNGEADTLIADLRRQLAARDQKITELTQQLTRRPIVQEVGGAPAPRVEVEAALSPLSHDMPGNDGDLHPSARRILVAIARRHPIALTRAQLGTLSRFSPKGGAFQSHFKTLKARGFIVEEVGKTSITPDGLTYLGRENVLAPQTPEELVAMWRDVLTVGEQRLLDALMNVYPRAMSRQTLAAQTSYTASGGAFQGALKVLRENGLAEVNGNTVRASATLFMATELA